MRLIDADTLRQEVEKDRDASDMPKMWYQGVEYAINHIIHAPTVDPVKHGHWIAHGKAFMGATIEACSERGELLCGYNKAYCPNCGAKMDEVEDGV